MRAFFDTNVLVYLFDADAAGKQDRAREVLRRETEGGHAVLSAQVLQEFYVAVTRKLASPLDLETAYRATVDLGTLPLVQIDRHLIFAAIRRGRREQLSFWDALIVEAALEAGADRLYTEDLQDGRLIEGLRVTNPFL